MRLEVSFAKNSLAKPGGKYSAACVTGQLPRFLFLALSHTHRVLLVAAHTQGMEECALVGIGECVELGPAPGCTWQLGAHWAMAVSADLDLSALLFDKKVRPSHYALAMLLLLLLRARYYPRALYMLVLRPGNPTHPRSIPTRGVLAAAVALLGRDASSRA